MKSSSDPRHQKRISTFQQLFASSFSKAGTDVSQIQTIQPHVTTIDATIQKAAPQWPIDKISKVDLSILRLAVWELTIEKSTPTKVVIDEAIELAKEFGNEASPKFVNGVLGTVLKTQHIS